MTSRFGQYQAQYRFNIDRLIVRQYRIVHNNNINLMNLNISIFLRMSIFGVPINVPEYSNEEHISPQYYSPTEEPLTITR